MCSTWLGAAEIVHAKQKQTLCASSAAICQNAREHVFRRLNVYGFWVLHLRMRNRLTSGQRTYS